MTVLAAAAAVFGYRFVSRETGTGGGYKVYAYIPDATGVAPKSRVTISGIQVGVIDRIWLDNGRARVDIKMFPDQKLFEDATISKKASSLIGESFMVLTPGTPGKKQIDDNGEIKNYLSEADIAQLQASVKLILDDVKAVTATLRETVGSKDGQDQIAGILKNLNEVTNALNETVKENRRGVKDAIDSINGITRQAQPEIREILKNVRQLTADLRSFTAAANGEPAPAPAGEIAPPTSVRAPGAQPTPAAPPRPGTPGQPGQPGQAGQPGQPGQPAQPPLGAPPYAPQPGPQEPVAAGRPGSVRSTLERIDRASASLESMLKHADSVAARIDRGEGTVGRLLKDETLITEIESTVEDVGSLVGGVGRLQTIVGLRTDYNFLANTIKSYVELRLQPTEDKYYLIEIVNDPRGKTTFEQIDVDTTNPNDPPHYREIRATTTNAFRISFQFAKKFGPFTGRFGIKESTGGLGLDLRLLDNRFELQQDLFGFGEELSPRWRVALAYEFIRKLWLLGGVDDILNDDRRDYFVGLQLRFNDQDLKTILPFAPTTGL